MDQTQNTSPQPISEPLSEPISEPLAEGEVAVAPSERESFYRDRLRRFSTEAEVQAALSNRVSNIRGLSFGVFAVLALWAVFGDPLLAVRAGAVAGLLVFVASVVWHARVLRAEDIALRWVHVNREAAARVGEGWRDFAEAGARFQNPVHPYAGDLDLFGPGSLFQRMSVARTQFGQSRLASFLMNRATEDVVQQRQAAAQELAPKLEWRQNLEALALGQVPGLPGSATRRPEVGSADIEGLLAWAESKPAFTANRPLVIVSWLLPPVTLGLVTFAWLRGLHPLVWIAPVIVSSIVLLTARQHVSAVFAAVSAFQGAFLRFGPMLRLLEELEPESQRLRELRASLDTAAGKPPSAVMRDFERIVGFFELRHNGMIYPFVNGLLLWDLHCVLRLEAWQERAGSRLRKWFLALGEVEALSSLAGLADDNEEFTWPEVVGGEARFSSVALGHPMIARTKRVTNDVDLTSQTSALLVTGSNMSGKSTLLRAMGVNIALALAGGPVCAERMTLTPLALRSSMRISDSLGDGVSHFYAEVRKLKAVLDSLGGDVKVFFLLDEILHGTNSRERQIGARWVMGELVRCGALGAVSTHDSGLCELPPELMERVRQVHLRETVEGEEMTFDYKLYPGPVRSGNALRLMRASGIDVPLE